MLTVITPTGERPEAFDLCQRMLRRQTYAGPVHWIVVDDGQKPQKVSLSRKGWRVTVLRPEPFWSPGQNTQGRNLKAALEVADVESIVTVWEDDDWYHQDWLQWIVDHIDQAELIGEANAIYYNVRSRRWRALRNDEHASLRCSAMRGAAIETFADVLTRPNKYYDLRLWARHESKRAIPGGLTLGMKSMPGRPGIALGHEEHRGNLDPHLKKLRELIGDDADWYAKFSEELKMPRKQPVVIRPFRYARRDYMPGDVFDAVKRIDVELHIHAKKVELRDVEKPTKERSPARQMVVETQEQKLADEISVKGQDPSATEDETSSFEKSEEENKSGKPILKRRGRKPQPSKDD